jgi:amino acid adenylation domain-containing protein
MNYRHNCLHQLFEEQAAKHPEAIAISTENKKITYRELNERANRLAHYLIKEGVGPEVKVGICVGRSWKMVVGIIGILKAGGAYVPLDLAYPKQRLAFVLEDAGVSILLSQQNLGEKFPSFNSRLFCFDRDWKNIISCESTNPVTKANPNTLAYVIYTSGSTGTPKGVAIEHRSSVAFIYWAIKQFTAKELSSVLASTSICFDLSVFELFAPLSVGGKAVLVKNALLLSQIPDSEEITLINTVPSAIVELLRIRAIPLSVCTVNLAGETLQAGIVRRIYRQTQVQKVYNLYGPTEATTYSTFALIAKEAKDLPPIGKPIDNTQVYLLDSQLKSVPPETVGELYIGGEGLARGYLNHPKLTAEKFIVTPSGARLYKTGDLCCFLPDGNLKFLQRSDRQTKIRGFRVEVGEIESVLSLHQNVEQVAVKTNRSPAGNNYLVAYIVPAFQQWSKQDSASNWNTQQNARWRKVFNTLYQEQSNSALVGWNNSYTRKPFLEEEMREWIEDTVRSLLNLKHDRILELGCGTGLLMFELLNSCTEYWGTDLSQSIISKLEQKVQSSKVTLCARAAHDFRQIPKNYFDLVILNSVVQYFPNIEYLSEVIEKSLMATAPGGFIFLGDIRSFPLLKTFHASLELSQGNLLNTLERFERIVQKHVGEEEELFVDPVYFTELKQRFPKISHIEILPKGGTFKNELNYFRYQVVIRVLRSDPIEHPTWVDWQNQELNLEKLRQILVAGRFDCLGVTNIPNASLLVPAKLLDKFAENPSTESIKEIEQRLQQNCQNIGTSLKELEEVGKNLPYRCKVSWADHNYRGFYTAIYKKDPNPDRDRPLLFDCATVTKQRVYGNNPLLIPQLRHYLAEKLPESAIPSQFVIQSSLPLTPNGKVDYKKLTTKFSSRNPSLSLVAPRNSYERNLQVIWSEILNVDSIGIDDNFFELGGNSLLATQIAVKISQTFDIDLSMNVLFEAVTIRDLARTLASTSTTTEDRSRTLSSVAKQTNSDCAPISFNQQRWFESQHNNLACVSLQVHFTGVLDRDLLFSSFNEIVNRHEILRTNFKKVGDSYIQIINPEQSISIPVTDLTELDKARRSSVLAEAIASHTQESFNLERGSLFRVKLYELEHLKSVAVVTAHQSIFDGWSIGVFLKELATLYSAALKSQSYPLEKLSLQFGHYAIWERQVLTGQILKKSEAYWRKQLDGARRTIVFSNIRANNSSKLSASRAIRQSFTIDCSLINAIEKLCVSQGVTKFIILLAVYNVLLYKSSGERDFTVFTSFSGRSYPEVEKLIGYFNSSLPIRYRHEETFTFKSLLKYIKKTATEAYDNRLLPFTKIKNFFAAEAEKNNRISVKFLYDNFSVREIELPELKISVRQSDIEILANSDSILFLTESKSGIEGSLLFRSELFELSQVNAMIDNYCSLTRELVDNPDRLIN